MSNQVAPTLTLAWLTKPCQVILENPCMGPPPPQGSCQACRRPSGDRGFARTGTLSGCSQGYLHRGRCPCPHSQGYRSGAQKRNMDKIKPDSSVNILTSQYGVTIMGGFAYKEMVKTMKEVVEQRTGCTNIRLRVATGIRIQEPAEIIEHYELDELFDGKASPALFLDKGCRSRPNSEPCTALRKYMTPIYIMPITASRGNSTCTG